ncbi:hypothetical protein [Neolewinella antarctica]|uniref:Uncharacterized protein n=1 Tax=Neolewinella antarctica TaxID=442734 RepID=A0ABX0X6H3_9BACT|nr:hypothetical protein [Neolewinella antarctica]NJC24807.1 hypothetical protein [Neolewinella antarctica]
MKIPPTKIFQYLSEVVPILGLIADWLPSFEQRMANRKLRHKRRHADGKISQSRLELELEGIEAKKVAYYKTHPKP